MEYYKFHNMNKGFYFIDNKTGKPVMRSALYHKFAEDELILIAISNNAYNGYTRVPKPDFKDGKYCGVLEGEGNPSRLYRNCLDQRPAPLPRVYDHKR